MSSALSNEYQPDSVSSPGETLLETLNTLEMSQADLARRMGRPVKTMNEIIQGKAAITAETALQLEQVLHVPASFWLNREQNYREALARLAEEQRLLSWIEWLKEFPVREMTRRGWLPASADTPQQVSETLKFFGVATPEAWRNIWEHKVVAYRRSTFITSSFGAITAWLRRGEIEARQIECAPYNDVAFRDALTVIRTLAREPVTLFQKELTHLCASAGVAVVFVQELPKTGICGATQWATSNKALVQLSLRYKTDDHLWFTFFHEAGHILLHGKRQIFLEIGQREREKAENEANLFASNMLIDSSQWQHLFYQKPYLSYKN